MAWERVEGLPLRLETNLRRQLWQLPQCLSHSASVWQRREFLQYPAPIGRYSSQVQDPEKIFILNNTHTNYICEIITFKRELLNFYLKYQTLLITVMVVNKNYIPSSILTQILTILNN